MEEPTIAEALETVDQTAAFLFEVVSVTGDSIEVMGDSTEGGAAITGTAMPLSNR
jgi:hypothetical protein